MTMQVDLFGKLTSEMSKAQPHPTISGANFSLCGLYRFSLWRIWNDNVKVPKVMVIGLNPSTANADTDDATINRITSIAKHNGYGGLYMVNCFPIISRDPSVLPGYLSSPECQRSIRENDDELRKIKEKCADIVCAWGSFKEVIETGRGEEIRKMFPKALALKVNKNGSPKHPLYCSKTSGFVNYDLV